MTFKKAKPYQPTGQTDLKCQSETVNSFGQLLMIVENKAILIIYKTRQYADSGGNWRRRNLKQPNK